MSTPDAYVPTSMTRITSLLDHARVGPSDYLLDLGSGDGRVVAAAIAHGAVAVGVEVDQTLAVASMEALSSHSGRIEVGDFWQHDWSPYTVVFAAVSNQYRKPIIDRWRALTHRIGDRLILTGDYSEIHVATAD